MRIISIMVVLAVAVGFAAAVPAAETDPVPPGQLTPGMTLVGPDATETYGSIGTTWSGTPRERGNIFSVATAANVTQIEFYLNPTAAETFYFSIYRKTNDGTVTGTYTRDLITSVAVGTTGQQWVSSGPVSYTLDPTYYYYMSVAWDSVISEYFRGTEATPFATGFGQLLTGVPAGSGHPATIDNTYAAGLFQPYYQRLTFDIVPVELMSLSVE